MAYRPVQRRDVWVEPMEAETMLYPASGGAVHVLHASAKLIWDLCDGQHSIEEIEQKLRERFAIPEGNMSPQISKERFKILDPKRAARRRSACGSAASRLKRGWILPALRCLTLHPLRSKRRDAALFRYTSRCKIHDSVCTASSLYTVRSKFFVYTGGIGNGRQTIRRWTG